MSPAMAARITDRLWDIGGIVKLIEDWEARDMSRILTAALFVFTLSAPALAGTVPEGVKLRAYPPVGKGDPNAISCWAWRATPPIRGLQCARNSDWARLNGLSPNQLDGLQQGQPPQMSGGWPWQSSSNNH